jgi:hypothetical protein
MGNIVRLVRQRHLASERKVRRVKDMRNIRGVPYDGTVVQRPVFRVTLHEWLAFLLYLVGQRGPATHNYRIASVKTMWLPIAQSWPR